MYCVEIDSNNSNIIDRLLFYIKDNNLLKGNNFILEGSYNIYDDNYFLYYPQDKVEFKYNNEKIIVEYNKTRKSRNFNNIEVRFDKIRICSDISLEHIDEFITYLKKIKISHKKRKLVKYVWKDEYWKYTSEFKKRKLTNIYLPKIDKSAIITNIETFLFNNDIEDLYNKLDIPNKKIFLFHGIPGSGKTSTICSLAAEYKYNICIVKNVKDLDDNSLDDMLYKLPNKSFLIFEDIDCIFQRRETTSFKTNISFSGLLNMLDGVGNYNKLLIFITTNYIELLDEALKRRIDLFIEFSYAKKQEIMDMYKTFFSNEYVNEIQESELEEFCERIKYKKITINALEKFFVNCLQNKTTPINNIEFLDNYINITKKNDITNLYN